MRGELLLRAVLAQTRAELLLTMRRGESVLVTLVVPALLLLFFGLVGMLPVAAERPVDVLLPGLLALAVISTSMVSLGIATAFERHYGVLKRLGSTPLPRAGLLAAKMLSVLVLEGVQAVLLLAIAALAFGWAPAGRAGLALLALLLGTATFAGLGLLMAGSLRAEATLAVANGLYLAFLLLGGIMLPVDRLPGGLAELARLLPAAALSQALRTALAPEAGSAGTSLALLAGWAVLTTLAAVRTFRWE
jgi:ABC-2 type transport system permease protein